MAKVDCITFYQASNYVEYSDTDIQTDYFNSYTTSVRLMTKWVKEDGADKIVLRFVNREERPKFYKRLARLCAETGYSFEKITEVKHDHLGQEWYDFHFLLTKSVM